MQAEIGPQSNSSAEAGVQDRSVYSENEETESSDIDRPNTEAGPEVPDERSKAFRGKKRKMKEMDPSSDDIFPKHKYVSSPHPPPDLLADGLKVIKD